MGFQRQDPEFEEDRRKADSFVPEASVGQIIQASAFEGFNQGTTSSLRRTQELDELHNQGPQLTPEMIKSEYGLKSETDLSRPEVEEIKRREDGAKERAAIINSASNSFLKGTALPFVSGMIGSLADPIDLAIGVATGGVTALGAKALLAKGATSAGSIAAVELGLDIIGNVVGNGITEVYNQEATQRELQEYTAEMYFNNVVMGSIAMTGAIHGLKRLPGGIKSGIELSKSKITRMGNKHVDATHRMAEVASELDVEVGPVVEKMEEISEKRLELDDNTKAAANEIFEDIIEEGDDMKTLIQRIDKGVRDGDIPVEDAIKFRGRAESLGTDPKKFSAVEDDPNVDFSDAERLEIEEVMNKPENKVGARELDKEPAQEYNPVESNSPEEEAHFDSIRERPEASVKEYVNRVAEIDEEMEAALAYSACISGGTV